MPAAQFFFGVLLYLFGRAPQRGFVFDYISLAENAWISFTHTDRDDDPSLMAEVVVSLGASSLLNAARWAGEITDNTLKVRQAEIDALQTRLESMS